MAVYLLILDDCENMDALLEIIEASRRLVSSYFECDASITISILSKIPPILRLTLTRPATEELQDALKCSLKVREIFISTEKNTSANTAKEEEPPKSLPIVHQPDSPLLSLPAEVRNSIYFYVLVEDKPIVLESVPRDSLDEKLREDQYKRPISPGLLHTCRQTREEASGRFYDEKKFEFVGCDPKWSEVYVWDVYYYEESIFRDWLTASDQRQKIKMPMCFHGHVLDDGFLPPFSVRWNRVKDWMRTCWSLDTPRWPKYCPHYCFDSFYEVQAVFGIAEYLRSETDLRWEDMAYILGEVEDLLLQMVYDWNV